LATQARLSALHYEHEETSFNYRPSSLLAAIGRGQLRTLEDRVQKRQANLQYYQNNMEAFPGIELMTGSSDRHSTRWLTCLLIAPVLFGCDPESVRVALEAENIEAHAT